MEPVAALPPIATRPAAESNAGAFVEAYGFALLAWFRGGDLQRDEADALARDLLQMMVREFAVIAAEPAARFRGWLQYAGHKAWCRLMEERVESAGGSPASDGANVLLSVEAHDIFLKSLDAECWVQRRREALNRVRDRADPADWEAFSLAILDGQSPADVAEVLQGSELAVHAASFRVRRLLGEELRVIEETS